MGPAGDCCRENIDKVNQQVSVMRKEVKNLRQMLDSAIRANRKHMMAIQSSVSTSGLRQSWGEQTTPSPAPDLSQAALERGNVQTVPIGYISSCFSVKNATPRQPTICGPSRAELRIQQSVFNNPEHSLFGLEHYSHIWIVFVFHKNGHLSYKAKVKPPRLDGKKVGVYSTRSPHRPNALGLTLAKLDKVVGDTLYLSDIDMIDGTPVLDVKPYIPEYDSPHTRKDLDPQLHDLPSCSASVHHKSDTEPLCDSKSKEFGDEHMEDLFSEGVRAVGPLSSQVAPRFSPSKSLTNVLEDVKIYLNQSDCCQVGHASEDKVPVPPKTERLESTAGDLTFGEEAYSTIAGWIRAPPVGSLEVRFTPNAERELAEFLPSDFAGSGETNKPKFKFLHSTEEAAAAISGVLSADPRSVYRRNRCRDRLFFFTLDTAHVTCWFGDGFAEVLQVRPLPQHDVSGASLQMGLDLSES
eukprot:XP_011611218.1 PREDICTED: nef-associated protein 1 isoform X1 [Takifugu rubripes]